VQPALVIDGSADRGTDGERWSAAARSESTLAAATRCTWKAAATCRPWSARPTTGHPAQVPGVVAALWTKHSAESNRQYLPDAAPDFDVIYAIRPDHSAARPPERTTGPDQGGRSPGQTVRPENHRA
jgi:hypothetical protein